MSQRYTREELDKLLYLVKINGNDERIPYSTNLMLRDLRVLIETALDKNNYKNFDFVELAAYAGPYLSSLYKNRWHSIQMLLDMPLKEVPLHINNVSIGILVPWRLKIGH